MATLTMATLTMATLTMATLTMPCGALYSLRPRNSTRYGVAPRGVLLRVLEGEVGFLVERAELRQHGEWRAEAPGRPAQLGVCVASGLGEEVTAEDERRLHTGRVITR